MEITECMLDAALRKATEAGLFARRSSAHEVQANREVMRLILHAAAEAAGMPEEESTEMWPIRKQGAAHTAHGHA
jgi:hypothetical protein